jgi:hypothetical protein
MFHFQICHWEAVLPNPLLVLVALPKPEKPEPDPNTLGLSSLVVVVATKATLANRLASYSKLWPAGLLNHLTCGILDWVMMLVRRSLTPAFFLHHLGLLEVLGRRSETLAPNVPYTFQHRSCRSGGSSAKPYGLFH